MDDPNPPDGSEWGEAAYRYMQDALAFARANASQQNQFQIWVRGDDQVPVTFDYRPDLGEGISIHDREATFQLDPWVFIYGGFSDTMTLLSQRDPDTYLTSLSGDIGDPDDATDNSFHVVTASNSSINLLNCRIDGCTIRDGTAIDYGQNPVIGFGGAGILVTNDAHLRVHRCRVTDCLSHNAGDGAGILIDDGAGAAITLCTIDNNSSDVDALTVRGGGIAVKSASIEDPVLIICSTIDSNRSRQGGGVYVADGSVKMINCVIINNEIITEGQGQLGAWGGGVMVGVDGNAHIVNCTFSLNSAVDGGAFAIADVEGTNISRIDNCIFWADDATDDQGEEIYIDDSVQDSGLLAVTNADIAELQGNGVYDPNSVLDLENPLSIDPEFVGNEDFHLLAISPLINQGGEGASPDQSPLGEDLFDLDQDTDDGEFTVDRDAHDLRVACALDWGAYEFQPTCEGDITGEGSIDINDQLIVINAWGSCGTLLPPVGCPGDIEPWPCGDGEVDVNDLLLVINNWGSCPVGDGPTGGGGGENNAAAIVQACIDAADAQQLTGEAWADAVLDCICSELGLGCGD